MTSNAGGDRISLLVSDIDGTLVTDDKRLTDAVAKAAAKLVSAGVHLSLVSSRPPMGFAELSRQMHLKAPIGAFNGGAILKPDLSVIEKLSVPEADAKIALDAFAEFGVDGWVFSFDTWFVTNPDGALVPKEKRTICHEPVVVPSFAPHLGEIGKLVASSHDHAAIAACETALVKRLGPGTTAKLSQPYYLDVTPAKSDKGYAVTRIAAVLGVPIGEVAVIGDMANDLPMFDVAPHRIAMGNGIAELKSRASFVSESNEHDGWAVAIERYVLPRAAQSAR